MRMIATSVGPVVHALAMVALFAAPAAAAPVFVSVHTWFFGTLDETGLDIQTVDSLVRSPTFDPTANVFFRSGPILQTTVIPLTPTHNGLTTYALGDGQIDIVFSWIDPDGSTRVGGFTAPLLAVDFEVTEVDDLPDSGHARGVIGPGLFDLDLSQYLGVKRHTLGGTYEMYVDVRTDPEEGFPRIIRHNDGSLSIAATAVPEPTALALLALAGTCCVVRPRRPR